MMEMLDDDFIEPPAELRNNDSDAEDIPKSLARRKNVTRTECTSEVSEFHTTPADGRVDLYDLIKPLSSDKVQQAELKKQLRRIDKKKKVLDVPLNKHELEQITRVVQYEKTSKEISQWESIVQKNRKAEQLKFPLNESGLKLHESVSEFVQQRQPRSQLEEEIAAVLNQSQPVIDVANQPLSKAQQAALRAMSLKEARLKRAELQKDRARAAFVAAKLRLQGKIKSKKYHRVQRRSKNKQEKKRLEQMADNDPEAYQDLVQKAERQRIQERMSLKHKGTSRFMQRQTRFGKYNLVSRQAVQDMLQEGQVRRQKMLPSDADRDHVTADSDSDDGDELIDESVIRKQKMEDMEADDEMEKLDEEDGNAVMNLPDDEEDEIVEESEQPPVTLQQSTNNERNTANRRRKADVRIDPNQYLVLESRPPGDGGSRTGTGVALAFAGDDDVVAEFAAEKRSVADRDRPKDIDLRLPGWGEWCGPGLTMRKRRKKRFVIKAPDTVTRKDQDLSHVIINETKDKTLAKHQVNSLPHPYKNVRDFERRIQQPVGRHWNNVATFKKLTKPRIVTRLGKVIAPIDKAETFKKENAKNTEQNSNRKQNRADRKRVKK